MSQRLSRLKKVVKKLAEWSAVAGVGIGMGIGLIPQHADSVKGLEGVVTIEKYRDGELYAKNSQHNMILNAGGTELLALMTGESANHYGTAGAQIGVGDGNTAEASSQTTLAGGNTHFEAMDSGYPTAAANNSVTWKATFETSDANFVWNEITLRQSVSSILFNRLTNSQAGWGTKTSAEEWVVNYQVWVAN